jgi:hypothetical protein
MIRPGPITFHVAPSLLAPVKSTFKIFLNKLMTRMSELCVPTISLLMLVEICESGYGILLFNLR